MHAGKNIPTQHPPPTPQPVDENQLYTLAALLACSSRPAS